MIYRIIQGDKDLAISASRKKEILSRAREADFVYALSTFFRLVFLLIGVVL